jgi:hypothetical protein
VPPGTDELGEVVVCDDHASQVERLEALEWRGELGDPRAGVGAPVVGYEPVHGRAGLPLHRERLEPREPREQACRGHGVAEGHRHVLPRERVDAVPPATHQRRGLPVARVLNKPQHQLQHLIGNPAAATATDAQSAGQPPRLRRLPTHRSRSGSGRIRRSQAQLAVYRGSSTPARRESTPARGGDMGFPLLPLALIRWCLELEQAERRKLLEGEERVERRTRWGGDLGSGVYFCAIQASSWGCHATSAGGRAGNLIGAHARTRRTRALSPAAAGWFVVSYCPFQLSSASGVCVVVEAVR